MDQYEVRYRNYRRARRSDRMVRVKAESKIDAITKVADIMQNYPFHIVAVFDCQCRRAAI